MNEISPTVIAAIATRLLNELPGASQVPRSPSDVQQMDSVPGAAQVHGDSGHAPSAAAHGVSVPGQAPVTGYGLTERPSDPVSPPGFAIGNLPLSLPATDPFAFSFVNAGQKVQSNTPPTDERFGARPTESPEGLRKFVSQVRGTSLQPTANYTGEGAGNRSLVGTLFQNRSAPAVGPRPFDVDAIRRDFPVLQQTVHGKPLVWFDNAATTQKPQSVIDAISHFYANDNSNIHRAAHSLAARSTDAYEQARRKVQLFLGAGSPNEIIWVRGTTEGINLIAQTYGRKFLQPGDEIVMSVLEHHANIVPWQMIAKERGAVIRVIPVNDRGEIMLEEYGQLLGPRTKLVSLTQASNSLGTILPVAEMTQMAKRYGARVLIDGAQSVAHIPVNMNELGADFFVFSGHKIFGPTGIGVVYAREELQEIMPPYQGGGNMIKNVTFEETTFQGPPAKFEAGTPNIADAIGLGAALDYFTQLGLPNIANYEHGLLEYATEQLSRIDGLRPIGTARNKVGVLSFVLKDRKTEEVGKLLDQEGIAVRAGHHCAQPSLRRFGVESTVRPSLSIYNNCEEIDRLVGAIKKILRQ